MYSSLGSFDCKKENKNSNSFSNNTGKASRKIEIPPHLANRSHDIKMWNPSGVHSQTNSNRTHVEPVWGVPTSYINPISEQMSQIASQNIERKLKASYTSPTRDCTSSHFVDSGVDGGVNGGVDSGVIVRMCDNVIITFPNEILSSDNMNGVDMYIAPKYKISPFDTHGDGSIYPQGPQMPSNLNVSEKVLDKRFENTSRELHTQTIQPSAYSQSRWNEPINNNLGISHNPEMDGVNMIKQSNGLRYYHRVDPQLVRDDLCKNRLEENPKRSGWSSNTGYYPQDPGSIKVENIYDPRGGGYGDPYRNYTDITTGQIRYYYGDVDAYKRPNFISRTNVDHIDFMTPQGSITPEYNRLVTQNDFKNITESTYSDDALFHRESMMESLMRKRNSEMWQQRAFPKKNGANYKCSSYVV